MRTVAIARCPEHGLHGERDRCFVCDQPCEQPQFVPLEDYERLKRAFDTLRHAVQEVIKVIEDLDL